MTEPTDKDRERARAWAEAEWLNPPPGSDEFVIMESERRGYAHCHAAGRKLGAADERARIVAAMRAFLDEYHSRETRHTVRAIADALERGEL